jgi:endoglucanase
VPEFPAGRDKYGEVLGKSWSFYQIQRNGPIPEGYPFSFVDSSMLNDLVIGGWFDAGDTLKINFPLGTTVSFLAWGLVEFKDAYQQTGHLNKALDTLRVAVDYLSASQIEPRKYVGQIGEPGIDHNWWGRPSEYPAGNARNAYIWNETMPAADLLGSAAAAIAAASMVYKESDPVYSDKLLNQAKDLYAWGQTVPGVHSSNYKWAITAYPSYDGDNDHMAWAAGWLFRATGETRYADEALAFWLASERGVYSSWDSVSAPLSSMMLSLSYRGQTIPGVTDYQSWYNSNFYVAWVENKGWGILKTRKGLTYPDW